MNFFAYPAFTGWATTYLKNERNIADGVVGDVLGWRFIGAAVGGGGGVSAGRGGDSELSVRSDAGVDFEIHGFGLWNRAFGHCRMGALDVGAVPAALTFQAAAAGCGSAKVELLAWTSAGRVGILTVVGEAECWGFQLQRGSELSAGASGTCRLLKTALRDTTEPRKPNGRRRCKETR